MVDAGPPVPLAGEALVRVLGAGVCRTDLAVMRDGGPVMPVTLGHEIVGEIVEGPGWSPGARVAVHPLIGCGACRACARGEDNLCRERAPDVPGITRDGGMAELVAVPARNLVGAEGLDPVAAAPLTDAGMTALHAVEHGRAWLADDAAAVVVGVGGLGHLAVQLIAATSGARVIAVDVDQSRLDLACRLGAAAGTLAGEQTPERLRAANGGRPVDVVFDFVGSQETLDLAAGVTGRGGAIIVTGGGGGRLSITAVMGAGRAPEREVTMIHTFGGAREDLKRALDLARSGAVRVESRTYGLEDAGEAMRALAAGEVLGRAVIVP